MKRVYAIRKQDESRYWNDVLGWTHISTADFYDEEPAPREGGTLTTILIGSTSRPAYDPEELKNTIRAVQRHNKYFTDASELELRDLIHRHMALLDREGGTYLSIAGFVITRFKLEDRSEFKISVSASLFSEASS